jgi:glycosyltransferase involved in cell wall biosynthesis
MIATNTVKIAFVCTFKPRKCGIATFTSDLIKNLGLASSGRIKPIVVAMQSDSTLSYDDPVKINIRKNIKNDYILAADYINSSGVEAVSIQHEFGLFGGSAGSYINLLLERINVPVITTLHTILQKPPVEYLNSLTEVCRLSDKIIVMNQRGIKMLRNIYSVPEHKITLIPHGIPDLPFSRSDRSKKRLGMSGRKTILTFGLLSQNKGIEVMLRAMPSIIKSDPGILYVVLGATHPEVLRCEGPAYQHKLKQIVSELKLQNNVLFHNRFVSDSELFDFLVAADIYVTPYLNAEQLTSGTLAFAVGAGKAVVSTAYWAAQELLANGRGRLVNFGDSRHLAQTIKEIVNDEAACAQMRKRAYNYGRSITWPRIGGTYWKLLKQQTTPMPAFNLDILKEARDAIVSNTTAVLGI